MIDRARDSAIKASMDAFVTRAMMIDITKGNFLTAHCELGGDSEIQAICRSIEGNMPGGAGPIISIAADNYFCIQAPLNDGSHWKVNSRGEVGRGLCGYVGYWSFAGNAQDLSPYANHGTIMSGTTNCTENPNHIDCQPIFAAQHGLTFDGENDVVVVPASTSLELTTTVTASVWVFWTEEPDAYEIIYLHQQWRGAPGISKGHGMQIQPDGRVAFFASPVTSLMAPALEPNRWTHIVGVRSATGTLAYYDGRLVASDDIHGTMLYEPGLALRIERHVGVTTQPYEGMIDEVRIYNRALSTEEIKTKFKATCAQFNACPQN